MGSSVWYESFCVIVASRRLTASAKNRLSFLDVTGQRKNGTFSSCPIKSSLPESNSNRRWDLRLETITTIGPKRQSGAPQIFGRHTGKEHSSLPLDRGSDT